MKKTVNFKPSEEEKIEFNCTCCEALGISDIIREMIEKDLKEDLRIETKRKSALSVPKIKTKGFQFSREEANAK